MSQRFFKCSHCGKIVAVVNDVPVPTMCCGEPMVELVANSTDAATEKHVPVVLVENNVVKVAVGEVEHPMTEAHLIEWVSIQTNFGNQRKVLKAGDVPHVEFALLPGEKVEAVYAFCNLHGLWVKK